MVADGLLTRQRYREVPPRVDYELTERSRELAPVIGALAKWGYDWTWSAPRTGEEVQIGAILRTAPGLLTPPASLRGVVEITVEGDRASNRTYVLAAGGGEVTISEAEVESSDAQVSGTVEAWVSALSADGDASGLTFTGDRGLSEGLLDGFVSLAAARAAA